MDPESSFELIKRAQAGDSSALDRLLARHRPRLMRYASGRLPRYAREMTDTDDLVQEAMLGTFRNFDTFENRGEWAVQDYLHTAVNNRIRNELERFHSRPRMEEISENVPSRALSPLQKAVGAEVWDWYVTTLNKLDAEDREAVISRFELGYSYKEVGQLLEKSEEAARKTVKRAIEKLAKSM